MLESISVFLSGDNGQVMYWVCALVGTFFFALSGIMYFFGFGGIDSDLEADGFEAADTGHMDTGFLEFKLLSFKTVFAFVMMFGWGGVLFGRDNGYGGFAGAFVCGIITMMLTAFLIALVLKLQQDGTKTLGSLCGKTGSVYLSIPANRAGTGKVVINSGDETREVKAMADEALPTGTPVRVVSVPGGGCVLVEQIKD